MKDLQIFNFNGLNDVRTVVKGEEVWFVAKDIADALGYTDTQAMTRRLDEDERNTYTDNSSGQGRTLSIINESGLYSSILGSSKSEAKEFKRWVTSDVLPTIRKTGKYDVAESEYLKEQLATAQVKLNIKADYAAKLEAANKRLTHPSVRNNHVMATKTVNVKGKNVTKKTLSYVEPPALVFEVDLDCPVLTKAELGIEFNVSEYTIYHVLSECNYTDCTGQPQSVAKGHYVIMEGKVYWSQSLMWRLLLKKGVLRPDEIVKYRNFKRTQGIFVPTSV